MQISCATCGKAHYKKPSDIKRCKSGKVFCSKECKDRFLRKGKTWPCLVCGKLIYRKPGKLRKNTYCSPKCAAKVNAPKRKTGKIVPCDNCGKLVYKKKYQLELKHHYCSKKCTGESTKHLLYGEARYNWKGGKIARIKRKSQMRRKYMKDAGELFTKDIADTIKCSKGLCIYCDIKMAFDGDVFASNYANLEHIRPISRGGTNHRTNLRMACRQCNLEKGNKLLVELY